MQQQQQHIELNGVDPALLSEKEHGHMIHPEAAAVNESDKTAPIVTDHDNRDDRRSPWLVQYLLPKWNKVDNEGSTARDLLALERTNLAWIRTGISLMALGVAIAKFFADETTMVQRVVVIVCGLALIVFGSILFIYSTLRTSALHYALVRHNKFYMDSFSPLIFVVMGLCITAAAVVLVFIV